MDLSKLDRFNPEINWKGRHVKIGLVSFIASIYALSQTPAAMVLLGVASPAAAAIPSAVNAVVSVAAPIIGALVYSPKDSTAAAPAPAITPELVQGVVSAIQAADTVKKTAPVIIDAPEKKA